MLSHILINTTKMACWYKFYYSMTHLLNATKNQNCYSDIDIHFHSIFSKFLLPLTIIIGIFTPSYLEISNSNEPLYILSSHHFISFPIILSNLMVNVFHNSLDIHAFFLVNKLLKVSFRNKSVRVHLKSTQDCLALR